MNVRRSSADEPVERRAAPYPAGIPSGDRSAYPPDEGRQ